jgi:hypothetical protein
MTSKVDLAQFKTYNSIYRKSVFKSSPENPEYGTATGSQLSFFSQGVSFSSGKAVNRRSSMSVFTDSLGKGTIQRNLTLLHFLRFSRKKVIHKKEEKSRIAKKGSFPASFIISKEMRKFFGGAGNPTRLQKHLTQRRLYHA